MAIDRASVSAISLRQNLATSRESRQYVVAFTVCRWKHLATSRESKAHFGLPWVRRWDYRGKCHIDEKRIQCLSNASQHVPINRFPVIQPVSSNVRHFSTFFAHFGLLSVRPGTIAVNVTRLERGFNACKTPRCIYPSIFSRF